ncbi:MAG: purine-nucleoside phosphorylase [Bifidobacteriaceae bacterium]|jgi:purine-nucleoside phosphorylase|nr:purine-nucleoside phosphorylase [Bifidobacteriaceae bacterium]
MSQVDPGQGGANNSDGLSPQGLAAQAAEALTRLTGVDRYEIAIVLGSGWSAAAEQLGTVGAVVDASEIPGFTQADVPGHRGQLLAVKLAGSGADALVIAARNHYYSQRDAAAVALPIRMAAKAGAHCVLLTNGSGAVRPWPPGTVAIIEDHINLTAASPLVGSQFVDLTDLYSQRLRRVIAGLFPDLPCAVYAQFPGPQYETPAEIRAAATLGADLVGMSTALEAIAARAAGMEVAALSLVTNPAAGTSAGGISHAEVLEAGAREGNRLARLLAEVVPALVAATC